jgi:type I restriction enzyme S subunit
MRIPYEELKKVFVPVPPPAEQRRIADALDREEGALSAEKVVGQQIERIKEYRQTLISEAVTGKLDLQAAEAA